MPFMIGKAPIRRTLKYLEAGKLVLKEQIKIFTINYNTHGWHHTGAREFVFWNLPQIQYKNPDVQVLTFKNMTPSPFIRCFYETGHEMLIGIDSKTKEEIHSHLINVIGKSFSVLEAEAVAKEKKDNPANFGALCDRHCICEVPGQLPCPGTVPLPRQMRGKYKEFVFWNLPQIQYKNPDVQVLTFKNMTPSPFIRCFYETGHEMLIGIDSKTKEEIHSHLINVIGKSFSVLEAESVAKEKKDNPANFGALCDRHCICEVPGQLPCPGTVPLPRQMRGKYKYAKE